MVRKLFEKRKLEIIEINSKKEMIVDNTQTLKTKQKKLVDLYLSNMIDINYYKKEYENISAQIRKIEEQKKNNIELDYSHIDSFLKNNFIDIYNSFDNLEKRILWSSIIENIEIKGYNYIKINVY